MRPAVPFLASLLVFPSFSSDARAQGTDGHGITPPPSRGARGTPFWVTDVALRPAGASSVGLVVEAAAPPLVQYAQEGDAPEAEALLGPLAGGNLGATWAPTERIGVGLVAPVWMATGQGAALGDVALHGHLTALGGARGAAGVATFVRLPTGSAQRYVGGGGLGGGILTSGTVHSDRMVAAADAGLELEPTTDVPGLPGGAKARGAASVGALLGPLPSLHVEARASLPFAGGPSSGVAAETGVFARDEWGSAWWVVGGSAGLSGAPGVAAWRTYAGAGMRFGGDWAPEPIPPPPFSLQVRDPLGRPVRGADVTAGSLPLGTTGPDGRLQLPDETTPLQTLRVAARGLEDIVVDLPSEPGLVAVGMGWLPIELRVRVVDQRGALVPADIELEGPAVEPPAQDHVGTWSWTLEPGSWRLRVAADGLGTQERTVVVAPGRETDLEVDVVLLPHAGDEAVTLSFADDTGTPIEGVFAQADGQMVGTTASGGDIVLQGMKRNDVKVSAQHPGFDAVDDAVVEGAGVVELMPSPGTVRVAMRGPDGRATEGTVAFRGPGAVPSARVDRRGEDRFVLGPGEWTAIVSSPTLGRQERSFTVDPDEHMPLDLSVDFLPAADDGRLVVHVTDAKGIPVDGVALAVDGKSIGSTANGGQLTLDALPAGTHAVSATSDATRPWTSEVSVGTDGVVELDAVLGSRAGHVRIQALAPDGTPAVGLIRAAQADGAQVTESLDRWGRVALQLEPGAWKVLISSEALGMQSRTVHVDPDDPDPLDVVFHMGPPEGGRGTLLVTVVDVDGEPVPGASVRLDGRPLGATASGGVVEIPSLRAGERQLQIDAPAFVGSTTRVRVGSGTTESRVVLDHGAGAVELRCVGPRGPLAGVMLRLSGSEELGAMMTGPDGRRRLALAPGRWTLIASSEAHGMVDHTFEVAADGEGLQVVELRFKGRPTGVLLVRVRNEDHRPVADVEVTLDDRLRGRTTAGGAMLVEGIEPGNHDLGLDPNAPLLPVQAVVHAGGGSSQSAAVVPWPRTPVTLVARADEPMPELEVWLEGAALVPATWSDAPGSAELTLRPGTWRAHVRTETDWVGSADFSVEPGAESLTVEVPVAAAGIQMRDGVMLLEQVVLFDVGSSSLRPEAKPLLDAAAARLSADYTIARAEVQGHTDDTGGLALNLRLSHERAEAVLAALVERGVRPERLTARGYAMLRPVDLGTDADTRARNRRVEIRVVRSGEPTQRAPSPKVAAK